MAQSTFHHMFRANKIAFVAMLVLCVATVVLAADGVLEIDFRSVRVKPPALGFVGGSGGGGGIGGSGTATESPLTVTVVDSGLAACSNVQRFASVKLLNSGTNPIVLPWSPDGSQVVSAKTEGNQITFETLTVTLRSAEKPNLFVSRELFGRASVPGSQATLLPGESAFLRNIALPRKDNAMCGPDLIAEMSLSSDLAVKSGKGYLLRGHEQWRLRSK